MAFPGLVLVFLLLWGGAAGLELVVANSEDSGPGSLRAAIMTANAISGADTVRLSFKFFSSNLRAFR